MDTSKLKKFAQYARRSLIDQVSSKLVLVLAKGSAARRENAAAIKKLEEQISEHGKDQVIEKIAYIWFNRFCALRFMDVNRYTRIGLVSPIEGQFQPEILAEAKMGHIDEESVPEKIRQQIFALLGGTAPSQDPQAEAYRLLLVAACNDYHKAMPYLFERIADYTELLMPDDLLSGNSILAYTREAMTPNICQDVEVIGWLYQFYISEKKDTIINRRSVVAKDEIPAATQLFTPKWIVKYMTENSLGRLWMLNRPDSRLFEKMDYYIKSEQSETDFLYINKPEDIKIIDPACGSGHMLVYAFDLLYAIYEEEGVDPTEIPKKILTHNLYGIEIDERAGELAAFALTMKALQYDKRFFRRSTSLSEPVEPNICVLQNIHFDEREINEYIDFVGQDIFTLGLKTTLSQFEEADNFGSLIRPEVTDVKDILNILNKKDVSEHLFFSLTHQKVLQVLQQAGYLSSKYHVVIANPPYMGGNAMNVRLKSYLKDHYPNAKADLFAAFILRNTELSVRNGQLGFVTPFVWLFISSYKDLRRYILDRTTITSLVQLEYNAFAPACIPVATFTLENTNHTNFKGAYICLSDFRGSENQGPKTLEAIQTPDCGWFYRTLATNFRKIPSSPIAYSVSAEMINAFDKGIKINEIANITEGVKTGNNECFLRFWHEVSQSLFDQNVTPDNVSQVTELKKWVPYHKGGQYRRWYGNLDYVINWKNNGREIKDSKNSGLQGCQNYFKSGVVWSKLSSSYFGVRYLPNGVLFDSMSPGVFPYEPENIKAILAFLLSKVATQTIKILNPTLATQVGNVAGLPFLKFENGSEVTKLSQKCIKITNIDWNSFETSYEFSILLILLPNYKQSNLSATFNHVCAHWQETTLEMQRLEQENNCIFIDAYGLQNELTPDVPLNEVTLTCNPHYRYGNNKNEEELEALLLADTMKEFLSYAVGCMFGRYALDKPGLILANQGETIADYLKQIPEPIFSADDDNVIPMLDGDWFTDDVTERFGQFLKVTFGDAHYEENLKFIEQALGKDIRKYFLKDFYTDHLKRYKKRPIYWLFSSPKGTFNALIYMHRYRPDTVSVVLNDYLREFRTKLSAHKNHLEAVSISSNASAGEKTKALKDIENHRKMIDELDTYEREVLYPLATEQVEIDLDDGVKVNYQKFGEALKKIPGLAAKEEE